MERDRENETIFAQVLPPCVQPPGGARSTLTMMAGVLSVTGYIWNDRHGDEFIFIGKMGDGSKKPSRGEGKRRTSRCSTATPSFTATTSPTRW